MLIATGCFRPFLYIYLLITSIFEVFITKLLNCPIFFSTIPLLSHKLQNILLYTKMHVNQVAKNFYHIPNDYKIYHYQCHFYLA
jgi:hypothetical protein